MYIADTFTGVAKASTEDALYKGGEHSDTSQDIVESILKSTSNYQHFKILKGIFPDDTQNLIPENEKFCLCHIDVDVFSSAASIEEYVWDRLIIGGMVIFDDYGFHWCSGITKYVEQQRHKKDRVIIHNLNGHAIMIKIA